MVPPAAPTAPTTADQCKKGGWAEFATLGFKNQGDCVSYFATKGKNLGAVPAAVTADTSAAAADSATAPVKGSAKHADKSSAKTEREPTKVKANGHADKATTKTHSLELVDSRSTASGVMLQTYRPAGRATFGTAG